MSPHHLRYLTWLWPLLACAAGWMTIAERFDDAVHFDAKHVYLPAARAFLEQGWSYLLTPDSYRVVPLAYLWPALWGAEPEGIRIANAGLWAGCVFFLWHTARALGGYRAGAVAMLLWAFHPELRWYFPTELTEPIFLFGLFGWIFVLAQILVQRKTTSGTALLGAAMLTLTLLSRPVLQLIAPAGLLLCLLYTAHLRFARQEAADSERRRILACISWSLALGLALPMALVLKNGLLFGLWGLGTGAGTGLYLGTHPLFQGTEPPFFGFDYDINALVALKTGNGDNLSLAGDHAARDTALWQIRSMPLPEAVAFFARKLWWWLMHHPVPIEVFGSALRKWRLFELATITVCITGLALRWLRHQSPFAAMTAPSHWQATPSGTESSRLTLAAFLLTMFLLMLAQLVPILYNSRYSSALLDPWLILLTAFSMAFLTAPVQLQTTAQRDHWSVGLVARQGTAVWPVMVSMAAIWLMGATVYTVAREWENTAVDPRHMGATLARLHIASTDRVEAYGMERSNQRTWTITESPAALHIRIEPNDVEHLATVNPLNALWKTDIALVSGTGSRCDTSEISYRTADGQILQPRNRLPLLLPLRRSHASQSLVTHANNELRPRTPGSLRLVFHCPVGTQVQWFDTELLESRHPWDAVKHITP